MKPLDVLKICYRMGKKHIYIWRNFSFESITFDVQCTSWASYEILYCYKKTKIKLSTLAFQCERLGIIKVIVLPCNTSLVIFYNKKFLADPTKGTRSTRYLVLFLYGKKDTGRSCSQVRFYVISLADGHDCHLTEVLHTVTNDN